MSTLEIIVEDLKTLPPPKLADAAGYIHRLKEEVTWAGRLAALERSTAILTEAEGKELERIIEDGCEKIDPRDW